MAQPLNIVIQGEDNTQRAFASLAQNLNVMSAAINDSLSDLTQLAGGIEDSADEAGKAGGPLSAVGGIAAGIATGGVAILIGALATVGATLAGVSTAGLKWATEFASGMKTVEAQTGITGEQLDNFRGIAQDVFQAGVGESFADVAQAMTQVHQITGQVSEDLQMLTADALVVSEVFDKDIQESVRAVDQAMINFGVDGQNVFDMITTSIQATGDPADDLLDTVNEYSANFAEAGFSAEQMFGVLNSGLEAGAFNFDKVGDTVREFFTRLRDGSDTTAEALNELFSAPGDKISRLTGYIDELTWTIEEQEGALEDTKAALEDANTAWGAAQQIVKDLESALGEARSELDQLSRPNLAGMAAFDDQIFNLEQSINRARLSMLDMQEDTPEFEAAKAELEGLNKELDKTRLAQDIQYDAQFRALEVAAADSTQEVVTFDQAMAEVIAKKSEINGLAGALWNAQQAESAAAADAEQLNAAYDALTTQLEANKEELASVTQFLEDADTPAKQLFEDLSSGAITGADAMSQVIQALQEIEDPIERNQIGVGLFGSMWEDLGENVILALDPANAALSDFEGATGRAMEVTERGLGPAFERLKRTLKVAVGEGFAPVLTMLVENITPAFENFAEWLRGDGRAVMERFGKLLTDNLAPALENLGPFIEEKVIPALEKFAGWMVEEGIPAIQDLINWIVNDGIPAFIDLAKFITTKVVPAFKGIGKGVKPFIDGLKLIGKILSWFFKIFDKTLKAIGKIWHKWFGNSELLDSVYGFGQELVRTFVFFLAGVISEVLAWGKKLLEVIGDALNKVLAVVEKIWTAIKAFITTTMNTIQGIIETIWNAIKTFINTILSVIQGIVETVWTAIKTFIDTTMKAIQTIIETIWNAIKTFIDTVLKAIQRIVEIVWDAIKTFIDNTMSAIQTIIETVWNAIKTFIDTVMSAIQGIIETVWNAIETFIDTVMQAIQTIIETVWSAIETFIDTTMSAIQGIIETIWGAIESFIDTTLNAIQGIIETVWGAIETFIDTTMGAIRGIIEDIWGGIQSFIDTTLNAIRSIIETVWAAIQTAIENVMNFIRDIVTAVWDAVKTAWETALGALKTAVETLWGAIQIAIDTVIQFITNTVTNIWDAVKTAWDIAILGLETIIGLLSTAVQGVIDAVTSVPTGIWDTISSAWQTGLSAINSAIDTVVGVIDSLIDAVRTAIEWVRDLLELIGLIPGDVGIGTAGAGIAMPQFDPGMNLATSLPGGNGNMTANTVNMGGQTFNAAINNNMDAEEFTFRVQAALQQLTNG